MPTFVFKGRNRLNEMVSGEREAASQDEEAFFDPYAAENPGEFFAVMSEAFFETPQELLAEYPALYAHFSAFYRQDPARRGLRPPAE